MENQEYDYSGELKKLAVVIAMSAAAAGLGIIMIVLTAMHGKISWAGIILTICMVANIIPQAVNRRRIKAEHVNQNPRL